MTSNHMLIRLDHVCSQCNQSIPEGDDVCPEHPRAMLRSYPVWIESDISIFEGFDFTDDEVTSVRSMRMAG